MNHRRNQRKLSRTSSHRKALLRNTSLSAADIARESLRPGGRLLQWVQLYAMPPEDLYSILAALRAEFGNVYAFSHGDEEPDLLLEVWSHDATTVAQREGLRECRKP